MGVTAYMEHSSTVNENEVMNFTGKWMEIGKIILDEITQTQEDNCLMLSPSSSSESLPVSV